MAGRSVDRWVDRRWAEMMPMNFNTETPKLQFLILGGNPNGRPIGQPNGRLLGGPPLASPRRPAAATAGRCRRRPRAFLATGPTKSGIVEFCGGVDPARGIKRNRLYFFTVTESTFPRWEALKERLQVIVTEKRLTKKLALEIRGEFSDAA